MACFDTFAIVSLQQVESLDDRFERAVEEAFADLEIKSELRIPLDRKFRQRQEVTEFGQVELIKQDLHRN